MRPTLRKIRLRAVWLIVLPFFLFARPTSTSIVLGSVIALLGLALRGWAAGTIHKDEHLTVSGPYAHLRHPLYVGSLVLGIGVTVAGGSWIWPTLFLLFYGAVYTRVMQEEGQRLSELFPADFPSYSAEVPAVVPRLRPYAGPTTPRGAAASPAQTASTGATAPTTPARFAWRQYRRNREWEAALGTAAAFALLAVKGWLGSGTF